MGPRPQAFDKLAARGCFWNGRGVDLWGSGEGLSVFEGPCEHIENWGSMG